MSQCIGHSYKCVHRKFYSFTFFVGKFKMLINAKNLTSSLLIARCKSKKKSKRVEINQIMTNINTEDKHNQSLYFEKINKVGRPLAM